MHLRQQELWTNQTCIWVSSLPFTSWVILGKSSLSLSYLIHEIGITSAYLIWRWSWGWNDEYESGLSVHSIIQILLVLFFRGVNRVLAVRSCFYYRSKNDKHLNSKERVKEGQKHVWLGTRKPWLLCGNDHCHLGHHWGLGVWVTQILPSCSEGGNPRKGLWWSSKRKTPFLGLMTNDISLKSGLRGFFHFLPKGSRSSKIPLFTL